MYVFIYMNMCMYSIITISLLCLYSYLKQLKCSIYYVLVSMNTAFGTSPSPGVHKSTYYDIAIHGRVCLSHFN